MELVKDRSSFEEPLDMAILGSKARVYRAAHPVQGANRRIQDALDARAELEEFCRRLAAHTRHGTFKDLPRLRDGFWRPLPNLHRLTAVRWRGVFLVLPDSDKVIALLFSEAPHDLRSRLDELLSQHAPPSKDEDE